MDLINYQNYRTYLQDILKDRVAQNSSYSLRALARDLGLKAPHLSEVLNSKKGLSVDSANKIAEALNHDKRERSYFCDLVSAADARSLQTRKMAQIRIYKERSKVDYNPLSPDIFKVVADWYHFAILELATLPNFKNDPQLIAEKLEVSFNDVVPAIARLVRLGLLIEKNGMLIKSDKPITTTNDTPSNAIKKVTLQLLKKAEAALYEQDISNRDYSTITMRIDRSKLPEAKEKIRQFRREMAQYLEEDAGSDLYCLAIQLFQLGCSESTAPLKGESNEEN